MSFDSKVKQGKASRPLINYWLNTGTPRPPIFKNVPKNAQKPLLLSRNNKNGSEDLLRPVCNMLFDSKARQGGAGWVADL
jgi:hypothetical protein